MATGFSWAPSSPAFAQLLTALHNETSPIFVVGGAVRDALLGAATHTRDLDVAVTDAANPLARRVADRLGWAYYPMDTTRDIARLVFAAGPRDTLVCDISRIRGADIDEDLRGRDFTINAMAFQISATATPNLIDITGGRADLQAGILRRVSPVSLADDTVRLLRAVRLAVQFGFEIEHETREQIQRLARTVRLASPERARDELWKMLATANPAVAVAELDTLGLLPYVLPEVTALKGVIQSSPHYQDVFAHSLTTVRYAAALRDWLLGRTPVAADPAFAMLRTALDPLLYRLRHLFADEIATGHSRAEWLVWHALLHDIGKPTTRSEELLPDGDTRIRFFDHEFTGSALAVTRLEQLRFSRHEAELSAAVVAGHMRPHLLHTSFAGEEISGRAAYRFFRDIGGRSLPTQAGIDTLMLALADYQAIYAESPPPDWAAYLAHVSQLLNFALEAATPGTRLAPLVDGHTLMQRLRLQPGPQVGDLLDKLLEAQVAGEIRTAEEGLQLAADWVNQGQAQTP